MLLPEENTTAAYVIRLDCTNPEGWRRFCEAVGESLSDLQTGLQFIDDPKYAGATPQDSLQLLDGRGFHSFAFFADKVSIEPPEFPVLVMDLYEERGRTFRVTAAAMPSVHANLWIANMDFADFADNVDQDGVFRGFPKSQSAN